MSLQRELYGAESLMFYFLKSLSCLVFFVYTHITPESLVCSLFCKGGSDPLVWVHLLCHSLDQAQQNPGQSHHFKAFPSHCLIASSESRTIKYSLPQKGRTEVRFLSFYPHSEGQLSAPQCSDLVSHTFAALCSLEYMDKNTLWGLQAFKCKKCQLS